MPQEPNQELNDDLRVQAERSFFGLRAMVDSAEDSMWAVDSEGRVVSYNEAFAKRMLECFGVVLRPGIQTDEVLPPELAAAWHELYRKVRMEGRLRFEYAAASGGLHDMILTPILDDGKYAGITCIMRDITQRKQTEQELEESRNRIESLLESSSDEVVSIDRELRILAFNSVFANMLLETVGIMPRVGMSFFELLPPERARLWPELFRKVEREGHCRIEYNIPGLRVLDMSLSVIRDGDKVIGISSSGRDITERKRNELELERLRDRLEEQVRERTRELEEARREAEAARDAAEAANRSKSLFLANMSHELRTPLNAILGFAELLSDEETLPQEPREMAGIISSSGEHLLSIINDILDLAKVESGKLEIARAEFEPGRMFGDLVRLLRVQAELKGIELHLEVPRPLPARLRSDPARLRQIIVNLLGNALKFTDRGSVRLVAGLVESEGEARLCLEVHDTGSGISAADRERIFEPFVQLQAKPGTGLGLAISRRYVEAMGGRMELESEMGQGSVFRVLVPVELVEALPHAPGEMTFPVFALEGAAGRRVLVIEDDSDNRRLMRAYLEPLGLSLREASDGAEGLSVCALWRPELVILDRRMPGMDGVEVVRQIRALGLPVRIAAVSAQAFKEDRAAMFEAGCDAFLAKPVDEKSVHETVARLLGFIEGS